MILNIVLNFIFMLLNNQILRASIISCETLAVLFWWNIIGKSNVLSFETALTQKTFGRGQSDLAPSCGSASNR